MFVMVISVLIFAVTFYFIVTEKLNRTIAALAGAIVIVIFGTITHFYTQTQALSVVDFNTIGLLIGMMIIVGMLKHTGVFDYIAIKAAKFSKGSTLKLMIFLGLITGFISMMVDNVTTIILIAPVTILISNILGVNPIPMLMAEILLSNIGGVATLVGDPPNMIIASASGFTFNDFLKVLFFKVLLVMACCILMLKLIYRRDLAKKSMTISSVMRMNEREAIKDRKGLYKCLIAIGAVFILFILQELLGFRPSFIAILGAAFLLLIIQPDVEVILKEVEWSVLIFFASLFVLIGGLEASGVFQLIAKKIVLIAKSDIKLAQLIILWLSALSSSIIGALPFTAIMIPVVKNMGLLGINTTPIWWTLALGAGLGGNGTPVGTAAGIVALSLSRRIRSPINFKSWFFSGTYVMLVSIVIISLFIILFS